MSVTINATTSGIGTTSSYQQNAGIVFSPQRTNGILKEMASSGGAGGGATTTFAGQYPALGTYVGYRCWFANYAASTATITLAKAAGVPTDLDTGASGTWATVGTNVSIPAATGSGATQIAPGLAVGPWVVQSSVARTDFPSETPLLQVRALPSAAGTWAFVGANAASEIFSTYGRRWAQGNVNADQVTTPTGMTLTRGGFYFPIAAVEFLYNQPVVTIASAGDSLVRGQTDGAGSVGFRSLDVRVAALKNASQTTKLWSPVTFCLSGQQHTPSYNTAIAIAQQMQPKYLLFRAYTVNDATTQAAFDNDYAELCIAVDTCIKYGVTPVLLTTGGTDSLSAPTIALLQASNAKILALRNAGAIVVDAAAAIYDPTTLALLPAYYGSDVAHTHAGDAGYDAIAALIASALT